MKNLRQWIGPLYAAIGAGACWASGPAGIKLDGTLGPWAAALVGPRYSIGQNLGKLSGSNLFFSFQYFNVATGETALFTTTSAGIGNVISRVTGGYGSTIDGTISLKPASGAPNFFLINPAGVTFTANAVVDVPAAFYVSTANYLKFSDGNFYADPSKMSTLSAAAPEAFGFLGTTRAAVNMKGANLSAGANGAGDIQVAAGDITIDGDGQLVGFQNTTGNIRVTAVGGNAAEVPLSGSFGAADGTVMIRNGGVLCTQGQGSSNGGAIEVYAGNLLIDGAGAGSNSTAQTGINTLTDSLGVGTDSAGPIIVSIGKAATIDNGGIILSSTFGPGNAGRTVFSAGTLKVDGFNALVNPLSDIPFATGFLSQSTASGLVGNITVDVPGSASINNGGEIAAIKFGGNDVPTTVIAGHFGSLLIDGGYLPQTTGIYMAGAGLAGQINISVAGSVSLVRGGVIDAYPGSSFIGGNVSGGSNITMHSDSLAIDGQGSGIFSDYPFDEGSAGQIDLDVTGRVSLTNGGMISASVLGGAAGQIRGRFGSLTIEAGTAATPDIFFESPTGIFSDTTFDGLAGHINIDVTGSASITNGGLISASSGNGNAGEITVHFGSLSIEGVNSSIVGPTAAQANSASGIVSDTYGGPSAGQIKVLVTGSASIADGGQIAATAGNVGQGGQITASFGSLSIDGNGVDVPHNVTGISTQSSGALGSTINVAVTGSTTIRDSGEITASIDSFDTPGKAGQINAQLGSLLIDGTSPALIYGTGILSTANGPASGGNIDIGAKGNVSILNTGAISTSANSLTGVGGIAGSIQLAVSKDLEIRGGGISAESFVVRGTPSAPSGAQVLITADKVTMKDGSISTASNGDPDGGYLQIGYRSGLSLTDSTIATSSEDGNGGPLTISGGGPVLLTRSVISTSVSGLTNGDGGNIRISAPVIVFNTADINASVVAPANASDGRLIIDAQVVLPSYQSLLIGGAPITFDPNMLGLNAIQATTPHGVSGNFHVSTFDLSKPNDIPPTPKGFGRGPCVYAHGSSLSVAGRGGVAPTAYDPLWIDPVEAWREFLAGNRRPSAQEASIAAACR